MVMGWAEDGWGRLARWGKVGGAKLKKRWGGRREDEGVAMGKERLRMALCGGNGRGKDEYCAVMRKAEIY